ncbi:MAG: amino acid adenylation domain-containing protein, partial [Methylocapsa sp.]|nr:amino acid adenylation domain-containing protein [Methylocapsa sp.]
MLYRPSKAQEFQNDAVPKAAPAAAVLRGPERTDLIRDELLCEIFSATVERCPGAIAMATEEDKLTYAEADQRAETIARGLVRRGLRPGRVAGLWMPRGTELLIAQIAIAKIGAAWLPFDADAPPERVATCLADAEAFCLVTAPAFSAKITASCPIWISAELAAAPAQSENSAKVNARSLGARPGDPAYVIYTSGSTGTPKGIAIPGRNICHYLRAANEIYGIRADDIVFQGSSVAFDLSMEEIWIPYLAGASLFVASAALLGETERLACVMEAHGVTVVDAVPTLLGLLPRDVASLRLIILGGEACPPAIAARWSRAGRKIFNSYGPTETTVVATVAEVRPELPITIGRPIANYTCYVANDRLELLPRGVEGELLIGGPGVAKGYLRRDLLTREKFIKNPFVADPPDPVLYRSGDAVEIDPDGNILFRGRIDDQVKVRGFRVELGEIEAKLTDLPGIAQAAAVLRDGNGSEELVAFLVPSFEAEIELKSLRSELRASLPAYMIPARFEILPGLPKLASG